MARRPQVPGAARAMATNAAAQEATALEQQENETGVDNEPVPQVNQSEQEQSAPTNQELLEQIEQLKQQLINQNQTGESKPVAQHVRTRDVVGPHGWTKEVI